MPSKRKFNPYKWHIISTAQLPRWVKKKWGMHPYEKRPSEDEHFAYEIEQPHYHVKGKHYEYKEAVVETRGYIGSTHDSVIVRRKLKPIK